MINQQESIKAGDALRDDATRFMGAGLLNTAITFGLYQILLFVMEPSSAYAVTWAVGIGIVAIFYPLHVFRGGDTSGRARLLVALVYMCGFILGLGTVSALSTWCNIPRLAIVGALVLTTFFNFFAMRCVTRGMPARAAAKRQS